MIDQSALPLARHPGTMSLVLERLRLWNDARMSSHYDDCVFIWIPKNAGTSVYEMLRDHGLVKLKSPDAVRHYFRNSGRVTFGHVDISALVEKGFVSSDFIERAFKFAITRDPYARALSLYSYLLNHVMSNWHERPNFRDFLRLLADGRYDRIGLYNSRGLSQCNPQVEWLRPTWPDKIYKVENLGELVSDISERWRFPKRYIAHLNASDDRSRFELAREEESLIEKVYAEDFDMLGYNRRKSTTIRRR